MMPWLPARGVGSSIVPTIKDAADSLSSAQATLSKLSQYFCPNWTGFPDWKNRFNQAQSDLNNEAAAIQAAETGDAVNPIDPSLWDSYPYDTTTIDNIGNRLMSLDAEIQVVMDQCQTTGTPPPSGNNNNNPPAQGISTTTVVLIAAGVLALGGGAYWYFTRGRA